MPETITTKPMTRSEAARVAALARWGRYRKSPQVARGVELSRQQAQAAGQRAAQPKPSARRGGGGKKGGGGKGIDPAKAARQEQRDRERAEDRATRAADRQSRIEHQTQRDQERVQQQQAREAEKLRKELERQQKRGGGGGGGGKDKKDEQAAREARRRAERAAAVAQRRADQRRRLQEQGRRERGRLEERNRRTQQREQAQQQREQQRAEGLRVTTPQLANAAQRLSAGDALGTAEQAAMVRNGLARRDRDGNLILTSMGLRAVRQKSAGSFAVFKDATGRYRWLTITTTAFEDRDREVISTKAIAADVARADGDGQYGPLRWWHVGHPDPFNTAAPWGPGIDLGWCDFNAVSDSGLSLIESGTFLNEEIAQTIAQKAADYEVSPGFFHPMGEPGSDGIYHSIRRFERSLVPRWAGRASNLFTALAVQETAMQDIKRTALKQAGFSDEQIATFERTIETKEQSAQQQGIAYKSNEGAPIYTAPDGTPGIIQGGLWVALKATPPALPDAEEKDDGEGDIEVMAESATDDGGMGGEYIGDMTPAEFWAQLQQYLAPVLKVQELHKAVGDAIGEMKSMMGGYATKEAGHAAEIAALKEQQQKLTQRLLELEGDQPILINNLALKEALTSTGPQSPPDPNAPQIPNDPARPMAGIAARLVPELYTPWDGPQAPPSPAQQQGAQPATWNGWPTAGGGSNS